MDERDRSAHVTCAAHDKFSEKLESVEKTTWEVQYILVGKDGKNGLRSDIKQLCADVEGLEKWKVQAMTIFLLIQAIGLPVTIAIILKYLK